MITEIKICSINRYYVTYIYYFSFNFFLSYNDKKVNELLDKSDILKSSFELFL